MNKQIQLNTQSILC